MNKRVMIGIIIIMVTILIFFIFFNLNANKIYEKPFLPQPNNNQQIITEYVIEITAFGFSPDTLEIPLGSTVTFTNRDGSLHWPASDVHPSHKLYPGSDTAKCGTAEESEIFDACKGLAREESWEFIFNEVGLWNFHDHLHPSLRGGIKVT